MDKSLNNVESLEEYRYKKILNKYLDTIVKRDDFMLKKQIYLDAKHICISCDLMKEELLLKVNIKKLSIEENMLKSSINLNKKPNKEAIKNLINKETLKLNNNILDIDDLLKASKEYIKDYEKSEEYKNEISRLYKKMIFRISPTFNNLDTNKEKLLRKTELAYIYNNLDILKVLSNLLNENHTPTKTYTIEELIENTNKLNEEIQSMKKIYPFNVENKIDNKDYIKSYRDEIKERIENLKEEQESLYTRVNLLKNEIKKLNLI